MDKVNWLQERLPSRDSWKWVILTAAAIATYLSAEFDTFQSAFELSPQREQQVRIAAAVLSILAGKMSLSWMPSSEQKAIAKAEKSELEDIGKGLL